MSKTLLKSMNEEQIKIACAELDGFEKCTDPRYKSNELWHKQGVGYNTETKFSYTTSYDAIIPLLQKQPWEIKVVVMRLINKELGSFIMTDATTIQLATALFKATGKYTRL